MNFNRKTQDIKKTWNQKSDPYKFLVPNATVWIKLKEPDDNLNIFKKALIISVDLMKNIVKIRFLEVPQQNSIKSRIYEEYSTKDIYRLNSLYKPQGYDDMIKMIVVNEAENLWNLKNRFCQNIHYSYINTFLLFTNSKDVPQSLFSKTNINFYKKMLQKDDVLTTKDFLPHIYGEISDAIKALRTKNQAVFFQGESNSGKSLNFSKSVEFISLLNKESKESKKIEDFLDLSSILLNYS